MNYADLHCDTPLELYARGESLADCSTDISLRRLSRFERAVQLAAFCAPPDTDDDKAFDMCHSVYKYFSTDAVDCGCRICKSSADLDRALEDRRPAFVLTLEDARVTAGKLERVDELYALGVRCVAPLWGGESCIGGSHDTTLPLTHDGIAVVAHSAELGMILDISHASTRAADDILDIARLLGAPVIASHSCAYSVNKHSRNIHDRHARRIAQLGGVIGVNLYPPHLTGSSATLADAARHIYYLASLVGEDAVGLGCDFDGMGLYTSGGENVSCLQRLAFELRLLGMSDDLCEKILFSNVYAFLKRSI